MSLIPDDVLNFILSRIVGKALFFSIDWLLGRIKHWFKSRRLKRQKLKVPLYKVQTVYILVYRRGQRILTILILVYIM